MYVIYVFVQAYHIHKKILYLSTFTYISHIELMRDIEENRD